jgi:hypothetical protein
MYGRSGSPDNLWIYPYWIGTLTGHDNFLPNSFKAYYLTLSVQVFKKELYSSIPIATVFNTLNDG